MNKQLSTIELAKKRTDSDQLYFDLYFSDNVLFYLGYRGQFIEIDTLADISKELKQFSDVFESIQTQRVRYLQQLHNDLHVHFAMKRIEEDQIVIYTKNIGEEFRRLEKALIGFGKLIGLE